MSKRTLNTPLFDADNHLYETREALTKYLPDRYRGAVDYVDVHGRTKIVVRGQISDYIPNPTFDRVGRPGAQEEYFKVGNPEGKSSREIIGRGIDCPPAYRHAEPRLRLWRRPRFPRFPYWSHQGRIRRFCRAPPSQTPRYRRGATAPATAPWFGCLV